jgi:NAD(P)-dependent dehydrogenase (short-subunit alcohol dehydrogenase family)
MSAMNMFDLTGHVAVVTGGNGGLGLAFARGLVKSGADVAIWGRDQRKNSSAVEELAGLDGGAAQAFACDVANETQIAVALAATLDRFGRVDSCFANAGVGGGCALPEMTAEAWDGVMDVNARGVALTYASISTHMIERGGGGKLIATSSDQSIMGVNRSSNYAASKAAVNGLTRGAAFELARHGITANALLMGYYETDMTAAADPRFADWMTKRIPLRRFGDHEGLEGIAVFFASPHSDYITGQCLPIDGGLCIS